MMTTISNAIPEFNVGDEVVCIGPIETITIPDINPMAAGAGWKLGHEFKITSITNGLYEAVKGKIYWGPVLGGVYGKFLRLASRIKTVDADKLLSDIMALQNIIKG